MGTSSQFRRDRLPSPLDYYRRQGVKLIGRGEWRSALCPFHEDSTASLRIMVSTGGFFCHGCGESGRDVLAFHQQRYSLPFREAAQQLGAWEVRPYISRQPDHPAPQRSRDPLRLAARYHAERELGKEFKAEALHHYRDEYGRDIYWVARARNLKTGKKWIRPIRREGSHYVLGKPKFEGGTPLYRLDLLASRKAEIIVICEGEKCVDALVRRGVLATTSGGATSAENANWHPLKGRDILIWPDHDEPGQRYAVEVTQKLTGLASGVRVIDTSSLSLGVRGDAVDWLAVNPSATFTDILALPVKGMDNKSAIDTAPELHSITSVLDAEVEMIADWISARCVRNAQAHGAFDFLYRDFCAWHGPEFAFWPSLFGAGLERLGVGHDGDFALGLALAEDLEPLNCSNGPVACTNFAR